MKRSRPIYWLLLLLTVTFTLGAVLLPRTWSWADNRSSSDSVMKLLFGEGRRMFANQFFVQADITFHSGYYPSIFEQARMEEERENDVAHHDDDDHPAAAPESGTIAGESDREVEAGGFMDKPADWIEGFGRHFMITEHTHLQGRSTREILPWLKISADLDPHNVETYTVAAYWLRKDLGQVDQAEQFLREGQRANPDSYEILFELGCLYDEARHDATRARNLWRAALRHWNEKERNQREPDDKSGNKILDHLAHLEQEQGNYAEAIHWFEQAKEHSPNPAALQTQIDALRARLAAGKPGADSKR